MRKFINKSNNCLYLINTSSIKDLTATALHESLGLSVYHCIKYSFQVVFVLSVKIVALD